jgi:hypothetical protein
LSSFDRTTVMFLVKAIALPTTTAPLRRAGEGGKTVMLVCADEPLHPIDEQNTATAMNQT